MTINGNDFVNHFSVQSLEVKARTENVNPSDVPGLYDVYYSGSGVKFNVYSPSLQGQLKGLIDVRDGNNGFYFSGSNATVSTDRNKLTLTPNEAMRLDVNNASGKIKVTGTIGDDTNRVVRELSYEKYDIDGNGNYIFTLSDSLPADFKPETATIGVTTDYKGIPHYMDRLNELVRTFAKAINEGLDRNGKPIEGVVGHINGFCIDLDDKDGKPQKLGTLFFSYDKLVTNGSITNYNLMTCENFQVNSALLDSHELFASALTDDEGVDGNKLIRQLISLKDFKGMFSQGKVSDYVIGIGSEIGVDLAQAENFENNYEDVTMAIQRQRLSVSGVDLSEEMANMIKYQQLLKATSKLINVINEVYDIMINRTGV